VTALAMRDVAVPVPDRPGYAAPLRAVDEVWMDRSGDALSVRARLAVDPGELRGHFPGFPIYPGVYVLESVAQAMSATVGEVLRPVAVHSVRFLAPLLGDDTLHVSIEARTEDTGWRVAARCTRADGTPSAELKASLSTVDGPALTDPPSTVDGPALDHAGIVALLPHRNPMVLIDRVPAIDPGRAIVAEKAVTGTEPCYRDLSETWASAAYAYPVSLMLESLGQAAALLWLRDAGAVAATDVLMFVGLRGYRVTGAAYPGDVLRHVVELITVKADTAFATGGTWVGDRRIASVDTIIAVQRPRSVLGASGAAVPSTTGDKEAGR
jgi:3-hydroxyacyl-[acyl-carrier-protein] dehydratase